MKIRRSFLPAVAVLVSMAALLSGCPWDDDDQIVAAARQGHLLDNNTVALWRLDESAATDNAADAAGGYTLQQFGSPGAVAGQVGNARQLNGSTKFFERQGDAAFGTAMNGDWTYEGWVYLDNTFSTAGILFVYNGLNFSSVSSDVILAEVGIWSDRKIYWHQWHNFSPANDFTAGFSASALPTGQFSHVAVSRTAQGGNQYTYRIYINGALDNTTANVAGLDYAVPGASHYIGLGAYTGNAGLGSGGAPLNARLDDTRISKVARSDNEVLQSYQRGH